MNILGDLLRIKEFRQDKAELEVARLREQLAQATTALAQARETLASLRIECGQRERELYADLCSRAVLLSDLDDVKLECDSMRGNINAHEAKVTEAEAARETAVEQLANARLEYQAATRNREKFFELDSLSAFERLREAARIEDLEMEEVVVKPPVHVEAGAEVVQ
jgi:flagellar biosynthesis chaperone FliJ